MMGPRSRQYWYKQLACWAVTVASTALLLAVHDLRYQCKATTSQPLHPQTMRLLRADDTAAGSSIGGRSSTGAPTPRGGPMVELIGAWRRSRPAACKGTQIVFAREFFASMKQERNEEVINAARSSIEANPCGLHRFIISNTSWVPVIEELQKETDASIEVYYTEVMLMSRLFEAAALSSTLGGGPGTIFAASTADVAVPRMDAVPKACPLAFKTKALLVMSRDDLHIKERDCEFYSAHGSFDVFVASADLVTPQAEHHHATGRGPMRRTRVNHGQNTARPRGKLVKICNVANLL